MTPPPGEPAFVRSHSPQPPPPPRPPPPAADIRPQLITVFVASLVGALFSAVSTKDFIRHLDRQVHTIHCSFIPGAGSALGESGCRTVMMSPYSSFFRESLWGGIPVSLWSLAVFAFLAYRSGTLALRGSAKRGEANFLLAAAALPLAMSVLYGLLSVLKVGATCKVCVGIYGASLAAFVGALLAWRRTRSTEDDRPRYPLWFGEGVAFVAALTVAFLVFSPSRGDASDDRQCGTLVQRDDPAGVMIALTTGGEVPAIEVLDPLCPACRAFDARLMASGFDDELALRGVLFPLDSTCNWMVTEEIHPGACLVSEAVLCAHGLGTEKDPAAARRVLAWSFANQEDLRALAKRDPAALKQTVESTFPEVKGCVGGHAAKNKLTKSLRWAVANAIPVLTPQLFVGNARVCDENTDLGLEYTVRRMLSEQTAARQEARR